MFRTDREGKCGGWKKLGYLPIFEKENAFEMMDEYDQILILDADIYIRPTASNIFEELPSEYGFGGVCECDMPITGAHSAKIKNYSHMQYSTVASKISNWRMENWGGLEFFNMGMMVLNTAVIKPFLRGQTPKEFLHRPRVPRYVGRRGCLQVVDRPDPAQLLVEERPDPSEAPRLEVQRSVRVIVGRQY